ncbi:TPA: serine--tRNA ligase, partial [Candidatus Wolfebacteria bacterium]|nr:serine--tRNA ligase [Candidatus Wolfebacteria bacterium]
MLNVEVIRENPELVKTKIAQKNKKPQLVDDFLAVDKQWREIATKIDAMRFEQRKLGEQKKIEEAKELKEEIKKLEEQHIVLESERMKLLYQIPNLQFDDVPVGKDEDENIVIRKWGEPIKFDFTPKDHMELGEALDIIDTKKASEVAGARYNYLKGEAALLEFAIINYVFSVLTSKDVITSIAQSVSPDLSVGTFVPVVPPVMIRSDVYVRMARLNIGVDDEDKFYMPKDDLYLIGSAEHTLGTLHMDETIEESSLPIRYVGFSSAFRREAGSYGEDTRGILRVHQFDKIEMETFCTPESSVEEQNFLVAIQEHLMQGLKL